MSDTITLWFTKAPDSPPGASEPSAELHFNLWRHAGSRKKDEDFLDVGILIENAEQLGTLSLYLPFDFEGRPKDLMELLRKKQNLLSGVFNEVVKFGAPFGGSPDVFTVTKDERHYLTCHGGLGPTRLDLQRNCNKGPGTILTFREQFCAGMRHPGGQYLRFRIPLDREASKAFSFRQDGSEGNFSLTWKQREYTEIRFNEMRSVSKSLRTILDDPQNLSMPISSVHAFLLRDMAFELLAAHSAPYKMRRLEGDLWEGYAPTSFGDDLSRFVVYHWKKVYEKPVAAQSVVVFAKFSYEPVNVPAYAVGIILLGATGSALQAMTTSWGWKTVGSFVGLAIVSFVIYFFTIVNKRPSGSDGSLRLKGRRRS